MSVKVSAPASTAKRQSSRIWSSGSPHLAGLARIRQITERIQKNNAYAKRSVRGQNPGHVKWADGEVFGYIDSFQRPTCSAIGAKCSFFITCPAFCPCYSAPSISTVTSHAKFKATHRFERTLPPLSPTRSTDCPGHGRLGLTRRAMGKEFVIQISGHNSDDGIE